MEKTVCYLIQSYTDSVALKNLVNLLLNDQKTMVFVHLDAKSDIREFYIDNERVYFIENREFVSWAGYAQGKLILNLINAAVNYKKKYQYYCFLSESDYPVYNGEELVDRILESKNIMLNCSEKQKNKVEKYWFYDFGIRSLWWNKFLSKLLNGVSEVLYKTRILRKDKRVIINGAKEDVFVSGPFWKYSYEQLEYIDRVFSSNPSIERYFKHAFAPCELIIPTIIASSPYADDIVFVDSYVNLNQLSGLCYFKYTGSRVDVLDENDLSDVISSRKPFMRKVREDKSRLLIEKLNNYKDIR